MSQSDLQAEAWRQYRQRVLVRGETIFVFQCVDCPTVFKGTGGMARDAGWRKVWRKKDGGVREQHDRCPACRGKRGRP